ncbi:hypothetical protein [Ottowia testudinis]|uniref:Response regulatory domain-containing protein n=1 Tax=Ottowia testudinis TaxID=2816950 RepID=A0A975H3Y6_9BURK|nr:hypothetical protein [Ottowia testudinis]QTD45766.1 hypothetical protein J1M35_02270 [Ottowia testudinis]
MRHTYIFVGLTPSERSLLESLFEFDQQAGEQLVPARRPEDAHLIVANGDDRAVIEGLRASNPHALIVLVGQPAGHPVDAMPVLRRPLEMHAVVEALSRLDWPSELQGSEPTDFGGTFGPSTTAPATPALSTPTHPEPTPEAPHRDASAFAPTTASDLGPAPAGTAASAPARALSARATWTTSEHAPLADAPARAGADAAFISDPDADVLVVAGALGRRSHTLPRGLRRLGVRVRLVEGADSALRSAELRPLPFVFLDQVSLGGELLPLARALVALRPLPGQPPHVVVVARRGSAFDRLRARAIGCVWMGVPIERERLLAFFARRGLHPRPRAG